jgi:uncharacterized membrane protein YkvA (DUF1232 family)
MAKNMLTSEDLPKYEKHYSEDAFWKKIGKIAKKAGIKLVYYALVLYYVLISPDTPKRYKAVIAGALGYLILPFDFISDIFPFVGMADDWAALVAAVAFVASSITDEVKTRAKLKVADWFGPVEDSQLGDLA